MIRECTACARSTATNAFATNEDRVVGDEWTASRKPLYRSKIAPNKLWRLGEALHTTLDFTRHLSKKAAEHVRELQKYLD